MQKFDYCLWNYLWNLYLLLYLYCFAIFIFFNYVLCCEFILSFLLIVTEMRNSLAEELYSESLNLSKMELDPIASAKIEHLDSQGKSFYVWHARCILSRSFFNRRTIKHFEQTLNVANHWLMKYLTFSILSKNNNCFSTTILWFFLTIIFL